MMVTCHSKTLLSSTSPAENPSTGFFARSATINKQDARDQEPIAANRGDKGGENSEPFGSVPLSCFWSRRLAWLAVPAMGRKQCSSIGSGLGFWRWGVVRRPREELLYFWGRERLWNREEEERTEQAGRFIRSLREFQVGLVNNDNRINFRG